MSQSDNPATADENPVFDLTQSVGHLLHKAQQLAAERFSWHEALTGGPALTQRQFAVLTAVQESEGLNQTDLVTATGIDRSTLAELVGRMSRNGLLERRTHPADARAKAVYLTQEGREVLENALPIAQAADQDILKSLSKPKRRALVDILTELAAFDPATIQIKKKKKKKKSDDDKAKKKKAKKG